MSIKECMWKNCKNSYYAFAAQATTVILKAITQVVFVHTLAAEYLGINGLFSNILTMLSLAEMGVGTAILFNLYEPVAINDVIRIKKLMNFYKSVYTKDWFVCVSDRDKPDTFS